ncbi:ATP-grasp domain-containing protein [Streptomyces mexicanus]|jgi:biotin carboxylase|uniref:ATP-grasp domain-containing protein n=1 Tax=Streptomyces mexicanus TaxID=178566 RepID=UPI003675B8AB
MTLRPPRPGTLLLVGAVDAHVRKAKDLGLRVVLVQHPTKTTPLQQELADVHVLADYTDFGVLAPLVDEHRAAWGFDAVLSLTEAGVENAARLNDRYGLGGTGHAVIARIRDKLAMRRHLAALDPAAVAAEPLRARADLTAFGDRHGYPFIVKPTNATASFGVFRVDSAADADRVWQEVAALRGRTTDRGTTLFTIGDFLMEEYIDGPEFSVESFSFGGRHVVVAVTEKFVDPATFTEVGHAVPARLPEDVVERVRACVVRFLDAVGVADGTCHTEVRIGARGPAVVESHHRAGGDAIPDLVRGAYGIDLVTLALGWPFGLVEEVPDRPAPRAGASTRFLVGDPGTVVSVAGVEAARAAAGVLTVRITARPGAPVRALQDNWDRLGLVAVTAADADAAIARGAEVIEEHLRITVRTADGTPATARVAPVSAGAAARPAAGARAEAVA